ncbi:MAG: hypothetical protein ABI675_03115 [Chitinophagaceae bacterium]
MHFRLMPFKDLETYLPGALKESFSFNDLECKDAEKKVQSFTSGLVAGLWVGVETSYVDKLYRDAYYNYYSSKLNEYKRDCIRLSFFAGEITLDDFFSDKSAEKLQDLFRGFIVIRPTVRNVIGRNVLHPSIIDKTIGYRVSIAKFSACIYGIKLWVEGFPHSSQDEEFMVCAETTIWATMEYFSTRYPEYQPMLPREIHKILATTTMERQVPSNGLNGLQMSFTLKELGFGVKIYSSGKNSAKEQEDLLDLIKIYVESGIPLMALMRNDYGTAHVVNVVGRTDFVTKVSPVPILTLPNGGQVSNYYNQDAKYLLVDDNHRAYADVPLDNPSCKYTGTEWMDCKIIGAVVPLHKRIYMEAIRAKKLALMGLSQFDKLFKLPNICIRLLLSSTRTFKHSVAHNPDLSPEHKTILLSLNMPKFVWIAEIGTQDSFANDKATGMLLLDATEPKKNEILAYLLENTYIGKVRDKVEVLSLPLPPFQIHQNLNLF